MALAPGSRLGGYDVVEPLGAGGMGEVYRARDVKLRRDIALKVLPRELADDAERRGRLLREARAAAALNHPNICTVYDVGEADGHAYISMEVVEGQPLSARLAGRPLAPDEVLRYGVQLADALTHAHERGVVHRDFKSANVMLTRDGRAKVLDFGLARLLDGDEVTHATTQESLGAPGHILGTLPYMAPEQLRGLPADARSDVWALGVVLYEMAAGVRPFTGATPFELSSAILNDAPAAPRRGCPEPLAHVALRCLEKSPERRYQRAADVRTALETIGSHGRAQRVAAGWTSTRAALFAIGGTLAAAVAATLAVPAVRERLFGDGGPGIRSIAVLPLENLSGDNGQEYFVAGVHEGLITDLARIGIQKVIAKPSSDAYKATTKSLRDIGRELGVDGLVTGAVHREGDRVRLTAQLIRAESAEVVWANRFERSAGDVLTLQNELVAAIATELRSRISPEQRARLAQPRPIASAAYDRYLRGRSMYSQMVAGAPDAPRFDAIVAEFEAAARLDPGFAAPHAALAGMYQLASQTSMRPPAQVAPTAKAAAQKAIELDEGLAEAHAALGGVLLWHEWDWAGAEREIRRALELNPDSVDALVASQTFALLVRGRVEEAEATSQRILALDPLNPFSRIQRIWLAFFSRDYDESIRRANGLEEVWPGHPMASFFLSQAYGVKRMGPESADACARAIAATSGGFNLQTTAMCAWALGTAGRADAARALVERLEQRQEPAWLDPAIMGSAYGGIGDLDRAFAWFERALEERSPNMIYMRQGPPWDFARSDPRFESLRRRMNFPG
jgi:serine/threonine-protein kinase